MLAAMKPSAQDVQAAIPGLSENFPLTHDEHEEAPDELYLPERHWEHWLCPVVPWEVPAEHSVHEEDPEDPE
jgi:hypothetical protein